MCVRALRTAPGGSVCPKAENKPLTEPVVRLPPSLRHHCHASFCPKLVSAN